MPQHKESSPKDAFYEHGRQLLKDAENSKDPAFAKLRAKAAKRYFDKDVLGNAKVSPTLALCLGVFYIVCAAAVSIYAALELEKKTFVEILVSCILLALILLLLLLALTGVMTEATIAKVIVKIWDKTLGKLKE